MGYYTRVLSKRADCPTVEELTIALRAERDDVDLRCHEGTELEWESLELAHRDGDAIAEIERNVVESGTLGAAEIAEFLEELGEGKPASAAEWLSTYLKDVKVIYAFRHLSGADHGNGDDALHLVSHAIWERGDAILQADGEGYTNEEGYHILWQFSDDVSGAWWMAVLQNGEWMSFEMQLGDGEHRKAFLDGRIPKGVTQA
jgi:hypothetical protein